MTKKTINTVKKEFFDFMCTAHERYKHIRFGIYVHTDPYNEGYGRKFVYAHSLVGPDINIYSHMNDYETRCIGIAREKFKNDLFVFSLEIYRKPSLISSILNYKSPQKNSYYTKININKITSFNFSRDSFTIHTDDWTFHFNDGSIYKNSFSIDIDLCPL